MDMTFTEKDDGVELPGVTIVVCMYRFRNDRQQNDKDAGNRLSATLSTIDDHEKVVEEQIDEKQLEAHTVLYLGEPSFLKGSRRFLHNR